MIFAMHIAEGFLPPVWSLLWTLAAAPFVVAGFRSLKRRIDDGVDAKLATASSGAFCFVLSALKIPSVTGSCSHPTGVGLGTTLIGPLPMTALGSIVLLFQAMLLAHGGFTTLGANIFSMAVVGPWVAWWVYRAGTAGGLSMSLAGGIAAGVSALATYCVTAVQLALAHPDPVSGVGGSLVEFLGIFALTQIPLSVVEAVITALALRWLSARSSLDIPALTGRVREGSLPARRVAWSLAGVVLLVTAPLVARSGAEWAGADARAIGTVTTIDPGYQPWFEGWWTPPSGEVASFLFALQAAIGAGVVGYVFGSRRRDARSALTDTSGS
ncbi:MAG: energy-coupling factor ABC transporter permease [Acidimicrobiales bacterium]